MKHQGPPNVALDPRTGDVVAHSKKTGPEITKRLIEQAAQAQAYAYYQRAAAEVMGFTPDPKDKTSLMRMAQFWWKQTYQHTQDDSAAFDRYVDFVRSKSNEFLIPSSTEPDLLINLMIARWCDQGFPVVTMGEKYFAALAATEIPQEVFEQVEAPWYCFMFEVPPGLLEVWDPDLTQRVRITRVLVQKHFGQETPLPGEKPASLNWLWRWIAFSESGQHIWRGGQPKDILVPITVREHDLHRYYDPEREEAFAEQLAHDQRLFIVIGRLVFNICLALTDQDNVERVGSSHARYEKGRRDPRFGAPEQRVYKLGKTIKVDCRPAVREWLGGQRKTGTVAVQFLVRGHWRNQAHGPKMALRRRQWIEPYWKGPEDGLIPLRAHTLGDEERGDENV